MRKPSHVARLLDAMPAAYLDETRQAFAQAAAQTGTRDMFFNLGGHTVCLRFAGENLVSLLVPAFAHAEIKSGAPRADLTIHCWDDQATGGLMPFPIATLTNCTRSNNCLGVATNERYRAFYHNWMHVLSCLDFESGEAFYCVLDAAHLPVCEQATPMKHLLNPLFNRSGKQLIHGAAVGTRHGSLILTAPAESGKSTTALACLKHGLLYQADDLCAVSNDDQPVSFSIYNSAKLRAGGLDRFPLWQDRLTHFEEFGEKKSYLYVHAHFPEKILNGAPIRALVFPRITSAPSSRLERATPLEAMRSVIPWTMRIVPTTEKEGERILLRVISRLPAYHLHLGADEAQTVDLLKNLIENQGRP